MRLTPTPTVPHTLACQVDADDGHGAVVVALADGATGAGLHVRERHAERRADAAAYLRVTQLRVLCEALLEALALCEIAEADEAAAAADAGAVAGVAGAEACQSDDLPIQINDLQVAEGAGFEPAGGC